VILIGTGSEVGLCMKAVQQLEACGVEARVVSMPSWNLFEAQDEAYRESVLPKALKQRVTVEAGSPYGWCRWAGDEGTIIAINQFGASGPGDQVMKHFGFTVERVTAAALRQLGRHDEAGKCVGDTVHMEYTPPESGHS
jgi:transketolase